MPDLLLELFSEEIPARMQAGAARDLERLMVGALSDRGLLFEGAKAFSGPRRLTLAVAGLPVKQKDVREELKGPKTDAPAAAIEGFLRKTGLTREALTVQKTPKGDFYLAVIEREGKETHSALADIIPEILSRFPWPKSMRWPQNVSEDFLATESGEAIVTETGERIVVETTSRWIRPLRSILCTFDGEVVPFSFAGVSSGRHTHGHRFLSEGSIEVRRFEDYEAALKKAHVILDAEERAAIIFEGVKSEAFVHGLELIPDEGLLAEVSGLVEWPVVHVGSIENQFMDVPPEILQTSMRTHQKYFSLRDPKSGKMANKFVLVANMIAQDGGKEIIAGNERVLRARLSDAKFFWDEDRKRTLESRADDLKGIVFHAKLGTQAERVARTEKLAGEIAGKIGAHVDLSQRAARLAKADLTSGVVGEFPELQGVMGRYYALHDGEMAVVADAIRDHYKPAGPSDAVPADKVAIAVALADKLDMLISFIGIGEKPTGSGDPFALRRAALGVIRTILENEIRLELPALVILANRRATSSKLDVESDKLVEKLPIWSELKGENEYRRLIELSRKTAQSLRDFNLDAVPPQEWEIDAALQVLNFISDRLRVSLKDKAIPHDRLEAIWSLAVETDLVRLVSRVEALQGFLKTDDGKNLLAGYKRAANILKAEEKKDGRTYISEVDEKLLPEPADKALHAALSKAIGAIGPALEKEDFAGAMREMAALRGPVDGFFDAVKVNADDPKLRENRLHLLAGLRAALHRVADFSRIEG